jgi:hypothetical protein
MDKVEEMVVVCLNLSNEQFGSQTEQIDIMELEDRLADAVESQGVGDFDGNEFGGGVGKIFFYGPSANGLLELIRPILQETTIPAGSYILARRGSHREEERIDL